MTVGDAALFTMLENTTHTFGSGAAISERPDQEVGLNKTRNCPRNRVRYTCGEGEERKTMSIQVKASKNLHHFGLSIDTPRKKPLPLFSTYSSTM